jgi:hypothetical protein
MPTYEYVRDGEVVERVAPVDHPDDYENTRLGVAVIDAREAAERGELGREYWRLAGEQLHNAPPVDDEDQGDGEGGQKPPPANESTTTEPARPARTSRRK